MNPRALAVTTLLLATAFVRPVVADSTVERQDLLEAIGKCSVIADDKVRLTCYDALTPHVKQALATPPEALSHPPTQEEQKSWFGFDLSDLFGSSPSEQTTPQSFGSDNLPAQKLKEETAAAEVDHVTAHVTQVSYSPEGKFIVFLDNNQIWRQLQGDTGKVIFKPDVSKNLVTISRGFFGSYDMVVNDEGVGHKVTRMR